jgi:hypothetical protein
LSDAPPAKKPGLKKRLGPLMMLIAAVFVAYSAYKLGARWQE